jgi:hypothetical protein
MSLLASVTTQACGAGLATQLFVTIGGELALETDVVGKHGSALSWRCGVGMRA